MSVNMTDEELKQFLKDNKDRIISLLAEDSAETQVDEEVEERDKLHQIKDKASEVNDKMREKASETKDKVKEKASETKDKTEEAMKEMYNALMNPEAHKHFVKMGMEFFMGMSQILSKAPIPKPVKKFQEDIAESKAEIQPEICRNNPDCLAKKKQDDGLEKIDLS